MAKQREKEERLAEMGLARRGPPPGPVPGGPGETSGGGAGAMPREAKKQGTFRM